MQGVAIPEYGYEALEALVLPLFGQPTEPAPKGIAKYCSAQSAEDAALLARLFKSIDAA